MAFDIDSIIAHINKNFFAKPQYYAVYIQGSGGVNGSKVPDATDDIMLNCSAVNVPGLNIGFQPDKRYGVGTVINYPNGKAFTEITMTFYESEFENERRYFTEWLDKIYDKKTRRFAFYKDYVKQIILNQYNRKNELVYKAEMFECYPTSVSPLDRGYGLDGIAQFTVAFQLAELQETYFNNDAPNKNTIVWDRPPDNIPPTIKKEKIIWSTPSSPSQPIRGNDAKNRVKGLPIIDTDLA